MNYTEIMYEAASGVATLTLNRPDRLNAWTSVMARETASALAMADADESVRVIVLTGAGRGFCSGADMSLLSTIVSTGFEASGAPSARRAPIPETSKPLIAAINGPAIGLGFALAIFSDLRIASESARLGTAFARRGLIAEFGLAWMLPRIVGLGNGLELLLSARLIGSAEALRMGLVSQVLPDVGFTEAVHEYAREIAAHVSPRSVRVIRQQVYAGLGQTLNEAFEMSEREMRSSLECEDFREGVAHFLEKRPPSFTGR